MEFDLGSGLEAIRPWITTAFIGSILALVVKLYIDRRKLLLAEKTRDQNFQLEVNADGRTNLQFVIDNLVAELERQAAAHSRCENEVAGLRDENRAQGNKLDGLARQFIAFSESVGRAIPPGNWSPEITIMMQQLDALGKAARDEI